MTLSFSRTAARVLGPLVIVAETWRRWQQVGDVRMWPFILDDYIAGGFLLYASVLAARPGSTRGPRVLAAAWGFAAGLMYGSFFGQLQHFGEGDPSGQPVVAVLVVKGVGLLLCVAGLVGALRGNGAAGEVQ